MRTRLFIDYWNFHIKWMDTAPPDARCDWTKLPRVLLAGAQASLSSADLGTLELSETRVYASYERERDAKLRGWLENFLDRQPGVRVSIKERRWRPRTVHCRHCDTAHKECPKCGKELGRAVEKGVDAQIVTDMFSLAWAGAFDVALLVTGDADFIPAVDNLQSKNFRVVNACWAGRGRELAAKCWASFELDSFIPQLTRSSS